MKIIGRSAGRSAVSSAAYRSGTELHDERTGRTHDFTAKSDVVHSEIMLPEGAPFRLSDRSVLWNEVEEAEHRKDSRLAREIEIALPRELKMAEAIELARSFVRDECVAHGMIADMNVHWGQASDGKAQPHAHVMLTTRTVGPDGFGLKETHWNNRTVLTGWRERWAVEVNRTLADRGLDLRIDHRSHAERGIALEPQGKIGAPSLRMEERGQKSDRAEEHRAIAWRNDARADLLAAGTDVIVGPGETVRSVLDGIRASVNAEAAERDRDRDVGQYRGR